MNLTVSINQTIEFLSCYLVGMSDCGKALDFFALISVGAGFKFLKKKWSFAFLVASHSVLFFLSSEMVQKPVKEKSLK